MPPQAFVLEEALTMLEATPGRLMALLTGVPAHWLRPAGDVEQWAAHEIVVHLIHGEQSNWLPRARHILSGDARPFAPFDPAGLLVAHEGATLDFLLTTFAAARRDSLAGVRALNLTDEALNQQGQHPALGTVTLAQLLATWVVHDLAHLAQLAHAVALPYRAAVGPWHLYLPILHVTDEPG